MSSLGPEHPEGFDPQAMTLEQLKGWYCALCHARLFADRSLGEYEIRFGDTTVSYELWACRPSCKKTAKAPAKATP